MTAMSDRQGVAVEVQNVDLSYGTNHILKDVSLSIRPGEFFAFLGPSGCGKTTLLRLIAGFNQADRGEVRLGGLDISHLPPWRRDVGMVFQSYALWPHMTVARNVAFGLEERKVPRAEIAPKVKSALALVGLEALADRYPSQLSGGQQQRVALARTIAVEPKVLLLDEPLSNLDAKMRVQVRRELRDLQQRLGLTTIFVTHDQEEANSICDRIAVLNDGAVQQVGTPMELYQRPANLFVASFLGTANILPGRIAGDGAGRIFAISDGAELPLPPGKLPPKQSKLVFRPQHAALNPAGSPGLAGTIAHREFLGAVVRYGVSIAGTEILVESPFGSAEDLRDIGSPVSVAVDVERVHFLDA
ncbi:MAG: ABC transporter ATP-binding protein [Hyphomicrobium sp.]|nr:ABC transporter ATP-binding protein [Hyphomicrobium sp.]MBN9277699.1 ABC transporter ATP-binding protein [Hyphomicrobium sp.]OJU25488.1 MAG: ABC transporter ATP-binding protein [Alphaproteobacteria bacterium 64-6]